MIFISAGHYPEKPGACFGDFCEHAEAVKWVNEIVGILDTNCMIVPIGTLKQKVEYINNYYAEGVVSICIEIHFNSAKSDGKHIGKGSECLYMPESQRGAYLAKGIQDALVEGEAFRDRGIKEGWYRMNRKNGPDYFLSKTKYYAAIIEPEFIQHVKRIEDNREATCGRIAAVLLKIQQEFNNA